MKWAGGGLAVLAAIGAVRAYRDWRWALRRSIEILEERQRRLITDPDGD